MQNFFNFGQFSKRQLFSGLMLFLSASLLWLCLQVNPASADSNKIVIRYWQPANFYVFKNDNTTTSPGTSGMFVIYKITSIQNLYPLFGADSKFFDFKLPNLFAVKPSQISGNTSLDPYFKSAPNSKTVPPGDFITNLGTFVVNVSGDPKSLKTAKIDLSYKSVQGLNISVLREPNLSGPIFEDSMTPQKAANYK
jgi:hypothetical protein